MELDVRHNADEVGRFVKVVFEDQLPFATARALNDAALGRAWKEVAPAASGIEIDAPGAVEPGAGRRRVLELQHQVLELRARAAG